MARELIVVFWNREVTFWWRVASILMLDIGIPEDGPDGVLQFLLGYMYSATALFCKPLSVEGAEMVFAVTTVTYLQV